MSRGTVTISVEEYDKLMAISEKGCVLSQYIDSCGNSGFSVLNADEALSKVVKSHLITSKMLKDVNSNSVSIWEHNLLKEKYNALNNEVVGLYKSIDILKNKWYVRLFNRGKR